MNVSERVIEGISIDTVFTIHVAGLDIPISDTVIASWIVMALLVLLAHRATRRLSTVPGRAQALAEALVSFARSFVEENTQGRGRAFAPFLGTLFLFIVAANLLPSLSPRGGFGFEPYFTIKPLTRDINVTAALAVAVIGVSIGARLRRSGLKGFLRSLIHPMPFMLPFNLMEYAIRPASLALRLFGNMLGGFIIMILAETVLPLVLPPVLGLYFDLFDGLLQAVVFAYLSTIFIAEALE